MKRRDRFESRVRVAECREAAARLLALGGRSVPPGAVVDAVVVD